MHALLVCSRKYATLPKWFFQYWFYNLTLEHTLQMIHIAWKNGSQVFVLFAQMTRSVTLVVTTAVAMVAACLWHSCVMVMMIVTTTLMRCFVTPSVTMSLHWMWPAHLSSVPQLAIPRSLRWGSCDMLGWRLWWRLWCKSSRSCMV